MGALYDYMFDQAIVMVESYAKEKMWIRKRNVQNLMRKPTGAAVQEGVMG